MSITTTAPLRFPNESAAYRAARDELLKSEIDLRRRIEAIAEQRRRLPLGGAPPEDYTFEEVPRGAGKNDVKTVRLSELFGPSGPSSSTKKSLLLYSFMFSAEMERPCPMCSAFLDGLDGDALHIEQRVSLAIVAKAPAKRLREIADARGWRNLRLISSANNSYNRDYHGERDAEQESMMNVFVRSGDVGGGNASNAITHFYATEMQDSEPNQNSRHLDLMWPLWGAFDLTPEGRDTSWYPKLSYGSP